MFSCNVGVYVDDLIVTENGLDEVATFKEQMSSRFKMSDTGLLSFYLGIEVKHGSNGTTLSQVAYVQKILEQAGMGSCNPCHTPMEHRLKMSKQSTAPEVNATEYHGLIGCLWYLVHTRLDIAFGIGYVSRFMERPTMEHLNVVTRVVRYIAGMINFNCHYGHGRKELHLLSYDDADMGGNIDTRKSSYVGHKMNSLNAQVYNHTNATIIRIRIA
jgi:hypothetical protein